MAKLLANRIAKLRRKAGQSLQEVADAVGVSKAHIFEIERGNADNPSMRLVMRLADHFGVSVASLVGEDPEGDGVDPQIQRMFRQAQNLDAKERQILDDMMKSLLKRRDG